MGLPIWFGALALFAALVGAGAWLKGRNPVLWFWYAVVLLPIAGLHVLILDWRKPCPHCKSRVPAAATTCPQCDWRFAPQT